MTDAPRQPKAFPTTQLSLVELAARGGADDWQQAWERFFRAYWPPLHAFLVRTGSSPDEALDTLQDFFVDGMEGRVLKGWDPEKGRLRTWLIACLQNVRRKSARRERARPDRRTFSFLDEEPGVPEPVTENPEDAFEREWTEVLGSRTLKAVRERLIAAGDGASLALLDRWVLAEARPDAERMASELGLSTANLYQKATRVRQAIVKEAESQARMLAASPREMQRERDEALRMLRK